MTYIKILFMALTAFFLSSAISVASSAPEKKEEVEEVGEFLPIPPISVAMYNKRKRPSGTMTVIVQLKIEDEDLMSDAMKILPRLKSAYMQETTKLALNFFDVNRPVNANILSRTLQNATNKVLKHKNALLLIGDIAVQKR